MTRYFDLGIHSCPMTTSSPHPQCRFGRGLIWGYRFDHEESVCYFKVTEFNNDRGIAYAYS